jgi:hypothetical protein
VHFCVGAGCKFTLHSCGLWQRTISYDVLVKAVGKSAASIISVKVQNRIYTMPMSAARSSNNVHERLSNYTL